MGNQKELTSSEGIRHNCGIAGIFARDSVVTADLIVSSLYSLNHRGQEGAGIFAVNQDGLSILFREAGLAKEIFSDDGNNQARERLNQLRKLQPRIAIGQDRYSTSGDLDAWQPFVGQGLALVHNGNLTNAMELSENLPEEVRDKVVSDSQIVHQLILNSDGESYEAKISQILPLIEGAYNLILATKEKLFACRDPWGFRPLVIGELANNQGFIVASETAAITPIKGAKFLRDVLPGEGIMIDQNGLRTFFIDKRKKRAGCIFEKVYLSAPDSIDSGQSVSEARTSWGRMLAKIDAQNGFLPEAIVAVQQSGVTAAIGYAQEMIDQLLANPSLFNKTLSEAREIASSLVPVIGVVANPYIGRTFISPNNRESGSMIKHRVNPLFISGKRVVVVDDSIVRGNASKAVDSVLRFQADSLKKEGAREVHFRVSSPPIKHPCFMGVDFATREQLIAHQRNGDIEKIRKAIGADSLRYLDHWQLVAGAMGIDPEALRTIPESEIYEHFGFCGACFNGQYPVEIKGCFGKR